MVGVEPERNNKQKRILRQWLFNPFQFIAGGNALLLGLIVMLLTASLGSLTNTHFDGVLDVHAGLEVPIWLFFAENLIDWLCMVLFLFLSALIISQSQWRFIDILGTQALSRWPTLLTALVMLPDANRRFVGYLMSKLGQSSEAAAVNSTDVAIFFISAIIAVLMIIWMVALMYKAYAVSCNVKGAKAVVTFIVSLVLAEAVSKVLILVLLISTLGTDVVLGKFIPKSTQRTVVISEFENDPQLIGTWQSVDFVSDINNFQPGIQLFKGDLYLKSIRFNSDGTTSSSDIWTKGWIFTDDGKTKAMYHVKPMAGNMYLFYPWLSGDVTIRGMKPQYYVLKKVSE